MKMLDELAIHKDNASANANRRFVSRYDAARPGDVFGRRRECRIRCCDRLRVDQGLAVESEFASLPARLREAVVIGEVEMDAVKDRQAEGPRRKKAEAERGQQRQALARVPGVKVIAEIRCPHDEAAEAAAGRGKCRYAQKCEG